MSSLYQLYKHKDKNGTGTVVNKTYTVPLSELYVEPGLNIREIDQDHVAEFRDAFIAGESVASKTPEEMNEMRRQWLLAFKENGIVSMEQINAGMRVARKQDRPFMPSPGQFVAWCKSESAVSAGLPDAVELVDMVYQYCRTRGQYPDAESYPWPEYNVTPVTLKHKACYWMVTGLYADMRANGLSDAELRRKAQDELMRMVRRLNAGEAIPEPVKQIPKLGGRPLSQEQGLNKIAEIRAKFGLGRGRS